jgi:amino acid adenylation domain-containing protein
LWYLDQLEPNAPIYTVRSAYRLTGELNDAALHASLNAVVARHEALQTTFPMRNGVPVQVVIPFREIDLPLNDLTGFPSDRRQVELSRVLDAEASRHFDLAKGPLLRARLVRCDSEEHILFLVAHHTVIDGWSLSILRRELVSRYEATVAGRSDGLPDLAIQYADYAVWQREWLQGERLERLLDYWRQQLGGTLARLEMPTDRPRPAIQSYRGTSQAFVIPGELVHRLTALGQSEGSTLFMVLLAAAVTLISRYSGQDEVVFGSPVANREYPELEALVGLFVNVLVLRTSTRNAGSFRALLREVRDVCLGAYGHQEMPFERLVQDLRPERDLSRTPLFQVLFAYQDTSGDPDEMGGVTWAPVQWHPPVARTDLAFWLEATRGGVTGALEYSTDLFDETTIARFLGHFQNLLGGITADPDCGLHELPLLAPDERHQLLEEWNATERGFPDRPVHELVAQQARRTPDATAVVFEGETLTYRELDQQANQLAHLLRQLGVEPTTRVGIMLGRSSEMVAALLAVLKSGAAYLPLDPEYPDERLSFMMEDAQLSAVISETSLLERIGTRTPHVICLDRERANIQQQARTAPDAEVSADDLAYVIYTSGSTGRPKGVEVRHRGLANFLTSMRREPGLGPDDVLLAVTTLSFDIAVLELLLPLIVGAPTVIASSEVAEDGARLAELLDQSGATVMQATPATWRLLLAAGWKGSDSLRILCGGEALAPELAGELINRSAALWNMYGPTETTVWSTCCRVVNPSSPISIGRPIGNTTLYVLDRAMQPVPVGVPGELFIGGAGLARGYWKRPELTAERFVRDPFSNDPDGVLYRTGDWVKYHADGRIEYVRRIDNQVKVRGYRIELGEIEAGLREHAWVAEAVVTVRSYGPADQRLVGYVVPVPGSQEPTGTELRTLLRERLPAYMVPAMFVTLEEFPLTPNGKIDRKALPEPGLLGGPSTEVVPPQTPMEMTIAKIWRAALGVEQLGVTDNFFDLGGHSLLSMQVIARIQEAVGVRLGARDMVLQTLGQIAAQCEERSTTRGDARESGLTRRLFRFVTGRGEATA